MKHHRHQLALMSALSLLLGAILGCAKLADKPTWTKVKKVAGKEQGLSHISGLVIDDEFAYVKIGGTIADQNERTSGLRKIALDSGAVMTLDDGKQLPQSENGGIAIDEDYVYWNTGGKILRISKDGNKREVVASEHVGIGVDMVLDNEKVYWTNHGYHSANSATVSPIYAVAKQGGKTELFADQQNIPHSLVVDEKFVYWLTVSGISKQAKAGGPPQVIYQAADVEGVDELAQDNESLYFGFRSKGNSRWGLRKVSKQGGEAQTLVKTYSLKPVVVDETNVYFFDEESMFQDAFCKVPKGGGPVSRLDYGYASGIITQSKRLIYFATGDDIRSFAK